MKRNARRTGRTDADGIGAGMDWRGVRKSARAPTPILKPVHDAVGVDKKRGLSLRVHREAKKPDGETQAATSKEKAHNNSTGLRTH